MIVMFSPLPRGCSALEKISNHVKYLKSNTLPAFAHRAAARRFTPAHILLSSLDPAGA
ncbi:hypothetical protein [Bradyrhizobium sp. 2TAF24]|uniref:hypothetical protein n=1 Tax=Bradyrhizobium sp. 2TAF24 TaxID=3233011 RepID=UPI003F8F60AB